MNTIGSRIKKIREEKGIKQEYMAYELDISQSNYGRLEKQDSRLTVPKIQKNCCSIRCFSSFIVW
ncbi:helix-turn-helix domain-containing protein [Elizabethkingia anophelis]|uniref:helix-turn-helix domain-containing protein n=1 Tax=Elizabethkingia anophelis TaxID=1117645 RepID=UPI00288ADA2B|nr:helix-turn-helix transcriptional regulator [Elizabethkingia anophelis]